MGQIERQSMCQRKVGDPEDSCEPFFDSLVRNRVRQDHANPAAKILDASDAEVLQCPLNIAYEPLLEIFPVAAFEGEFVVMDDGAAHGVSRMLKMVPFSPAQPRRAETRLSAGFVLGSTTSSTYPTWERAVLAAQGRVGGKQAPPVFVSPAALLDDHFEHPAKDLEGMTT